MEQKPYLHPRSAVRGGEPRGQPGQDQVRGEGRLGRKTEGGGQYCFPGGSSPQLNCERMTNSIFDTIFM